jgi:hypothetical protein
MNRLILNVAPQESFPVEDLSDDNTAILELLLQNNEIVSLSHDAAEEAVFLYPASHFSVKALALFVNWERLYKGMDLGATLYEATASLIKPQPELYDEMSSLVAIRSINPSYANGDDFMTTIIDAKDTITNDCPNLSYVISEVSRRYSSQLTEAAIAGAGLMRSSELMAKNHFTS